MKKSILVAAVFVFSGVTQFDSAEAGSAKAAPTAPKAAATQKNGLPVTPEQQLSAADNNLIITIDNTLKGMGQNIGDLGHQKGALAGALEDFRKEHNETLDKLNNLTTQHQDLNRKHDDLTAQHADLQENHRVLRENHDALQEDNEDMKGAIVVANGQVAQSDVERRAAINTHNEVRTHFLDVEKIYREVSAEAEKTRPNVAILKGAIARMGPIFENLGRAFRAGQNETNP
jgi:chromosome segregation ATPase